MTIHQGGEEAFESRKIKIHHIVGVALLAEESIICSSDVHVIAVRIGDSTCELSLLEYGPFGNFPLTVSMSFSRTAFCCEES